MSKTPEERAFDRRTSDYAAAIAEVVARPLTPEMQARYDSMSPRQREAFDHQRAMSARMRVHAGVVS